MKKEEDLLKYKNKKWLDDQKHIYEKLTRKMLECKTLADQMNEMTDMLKDKEAHVTINLLEVYAYIM